MTLSNAWVRKALVAALVFVVGNAQAEPLRIAVATNFKSTLEKLTDQYSKTSGIDVTISTGSTGALYAQIKHGAPFDIFFAADRQRPYMLEKDGRTSIRKAYATGTLAFWIPSNADVKEETLRNYVGNLAIASPRHAPYGMAATDTLNHLNVTGARIIRGANVAQAFNFVNTGNAEGGFVALSQLLDQKTRRSTYWIVPPDYHRPIEQQYVVMKDANPVHRSFLRHLHSDESAAVILKSGYSLPMPSLN